MPPNLFSENIYSVLFKVLLRKVKVTKKFNNISKVEESVKANVLKKFDRFRSAL